MKIATFHQPHFLPWPGYIARCIQSDIVVFLDDVKYKKLYFHNRCKIANHDGRFEWQTIPVDGKTVNSKINDVMIKAPPLFKKWFRSFRLTYQECGDFQEVWDFLLHIFATSYPSLYRFNTESIKWIIGKVCQEIDSVPPVYEYSSHLSESPSSRTLRLLSASEKLGIGTILMGDDSLRVHDIGLLSSRGISCKRHVHCSDEMFGQNKNIDPPISGLSFLHYCMREGWRGPSSRLISDWHIAY